MAYAFQIDSTLILPSQEIELGKIKNISLVIVRRDDSFTETRQCLLSYARELRDD